MPFKYLNKEEEDDFLNGGDYYFAIGNNAHDVIKNKLTSKSISGMYDLGGNAVNIDS